MSIKQQLLSVSQSHLSFILNCTSNVNVKPLLHMHQWVNHSCYSCLCTEEKILPPSPEKLALWCTEEFRKIVLHQFPLCLLGQLLSDKWPWNQRCDMVTILTIGMTSKSNAWTISWGGLWASSETLGHWRESKVMVVTNSLSLSG